MAYTDNSKVNINLLKENERLNQRIKELEKEKRELLIKLSYHLEKDDSN